MRQLQISVSQISKVFIDWSGDVLIQFSVHFTAQLYRIVWLKTTRTWNLICRKAPLWSLTSGMSIPSSGPAPIIKPCTYHIDLSRHPLWRFLGP